MRHNIRGSSLISETTAGGRSNYGRRCCDTADPSREGEASRVHLPQHESGGEESTVVCLFTQAHLTTRPGRIGGVSVQSPRAIPLQLLVETCTVHTIWNHKVEGDEISHASTCTNGNSQLNGLFEGRCLYRFACQSPALRTDEETPMPRVQREGLCQVWLIRSLIMVDRTICEGVGHVYLRSPKNLLV